MSNKKFELSLWHDVPGLTKITEEKICILASSDYTVGGAAGNIVLKCEYNGKETLTFDIPLKFADSLTGQMVTNPLCSKIIVKSKIKLWRDEKWWNRFGGNPITDTETGVVTYPGEWVQGRWYDFVVTQRKEKRSKRQISYSYTCDSLFINELSHTGYNLEFVPDTDIMSSNGMGTAHDLAERIVKGTDWRYIKTEVFPDYKEIYNPDTGEIVKQPVSTDKIQYLGGLDRYVYCCDYNSINITDSDVEDSDVEDSDVKTPEVKDYIDTTGLVESGKEYVQLTGSDNKIFEWRPTLNDPWQREVYNYNKTEIVTNYAAPAVIQDFGGTYIWKMGSSDENIKITTNLFSSLNLWEANPGVLDIESDYDNQNYYYYLNYECGSEETNYFYYLGNEGKPIDMGTIFACRVGAKVGEQSETEYDIELCDRVYTDTATSDVVVLEELGLSLSTDSDSLTNNLYYFICPKYVKNPVWRFSSFGNIKIKNISIFELQGYTSELNKYIQDKIGSGSGYGLLKDLDDPSHTEYNFEENKYEPEGLDPTYLFLPPNTISQDAYQDGIETYLCEFYINGKYEDRYLYKKFVDDFAPRKKTSYETDKRRAISGSKSNRMSLLETVSKTFNCFTKFIVEHDSSGHIVTDTAGRPKKYFTFSSELGRRQFNGFNYGVNLESIERTLDGSNLVSKMYVQPIENNNDRNGIITIQNSVYNDLRESFIYDFSYYLFMGLIDKQQFREDYNRLVQTIKFDNMEMLESTDRYNQLVNLLETQKAVLNAYQLTQNSLQTEVNKLLVTISWERFRSDQGTKTSVTRPYLAEKYTFPTIELNGMVSYDLSWTEFTSTYNDPPDGFGNIDVLSYYMGLNQYEGSVISPCGPDNINSALNTILSIQTTYLAMSDKIEQTKKNIENLEDEVSKVEARFEQLTKNKNSLINWFEKKYYQYLIEGTWQGKDYIDPDAYCLDAFRTMAVSCMPKVSYSINALDISKIANPQNPQDITWGDSFLYDVGDTTYVKDEDMFGVLEQKAMVASKTIYVDVSKPDAIELRNFETRFDELFQSVAAAVTTLQLNENIYSKAAAAFTADGAIDVSILQESFTNNKNLVLQNSSNTVTQDNYGITVSNTDNDGKMIRINSAGIFATQNNGQSWTAGITSDGINASLITAGEIDTSKIVIRNSSDPQYVFDEMGLTGYSDKEAGPGRSGQFTRFDKYGIYMGRNANEFTKGWDQRSWPVGGPVDYIQNRNIFSLTEQGLVVNSQTNEGVLSGSIKIKTDESRIETYSYEKVTEDEIPTFKESLRVRMGHIRQDGNKQVHGIDIYEGCFRMYGMTFEDAQAGGLQDTDASLYFRNDGDSVNLYINGNIVRTTYSSDNEPINTMNIGNNKQVSLVGLSNFFSYEARNAICFTNEDAAGGSEGNLAIGSFYNNDGSSRQNTAAISFVTDKLPDSGITEERALVITSGFLEETGKYNNSLILQAGGFYETVNAARISLEGSYDGSENTQIDIDSMNGSVRISGTSINLVPNGGAVGVNGDISIDGSINDIVMVHGGDPNAVVFRPSKSGDSQVRFAFIYKNSQGMIGYKVGEGNYTWMVIGSQTS